MARADDFYRAVTEFMDQTMGPDNTYAVSALRRLRDFEWSAQTLPFADFTKSLLSILGTIYPEKSEYIGEEPLRKLIEQVNVKSEARYVAFTSFLDPERAPGQKDRRYPWPYFEGLRVDEAMNEMTLAVTGMYGKRLPPQSGTPLRIITPWKYGYKGPKSIVHSSKWGTLFPPSSLDHHNSNAA